VLTAEEKRARKLASKTAYYNRNKEKAAAYAKQRRESHPELFRKRSMDYAARNPEKVRANVRAWQVKNRDKMNARTRASRAANREEYLQRRRDHYRRNKDKLTAQHRAWLAANHEKMAAWARDYYNGNKDRMHKYQAAFRDRNADRLAAKKKTPEFKVSRKATTAKHYATHKHRIAKRARAYKDANPEKAAAQARAAAKRFRENNPEKYRAIVANASQKRRAAVKRTPPDKMVTTAELLAIKKAANGICYYCRKKFTKLTYDHVEPVGVDGLHTAANIVMACKSCNCRKYNLSPAEFAKRIGRLLI
jgi:5-methylcytosine-specific restriction endonuclease McrA